MKEIDPTVLRTRSSLDITPEAFEQISEQANRLVSEYFRTISERPVRAENYAGKTIELIDSELNSEGVELEKILNECRILLDLSRHNGHPRFFGYVASPATPIGAYGDLIASALNANITCWRSGPAGTEIERMVVRWLGSLIDYDNSASGLLTSGGSMANMIGLLIASRRKAGPTVSRAGLWNSGSPLTIYASTEVHMSVAKAADILGLGREHVRLVDCDSRQRINIDALKTSIAKDVSDGFRPCCVIGNAGTVNTGAIDPLQEIANVAKEFDLWFHVDGAYGAPGIMDRTKKSLFAGLARADSVSLDPHKWLYVPVDAGCLLFRDDAAARFAFQTEDADYIKLHGHADDEAFAFWDYGVELSRRLRALKIWLTLRYYGTSQLAKAVSEDISLAVYLGQIVAQSSDFELLAPVELSICCFRYVPPALARGLASGTETERVTINRRLDQLNETIMSRVQTGGRAYLSNATVNGHFALRACITNFRTTKIDIEQTVEIVRETAALVDAS